MAMFREGDKIWVEEEGGQLRPGIFVGDADQATWFGGAPMAYVVFPDTREGQEVSIARVTRREDGDAAT